MDRKNPIKQHFKELKETSKRLVTIDEVATQLNKNIKDVMIIVLRSNSSVAVTKNGKEYYDIEKIKAYMKTM